MEIIKKIAKKNADIYAGGRVPTIAFFGDSVTHGCFEIYQTSETALETEFDQRNAYHTILKNLLSDIFPKCPLNILNAGISGDNATNAYPRLERDVLSFKPDLVVVMFGLNDCSSGEQGLDSYVLNLKKIVNDCLSSGAEVILMTPNDMASSVDPHIEYYQGDFVKKAVKNCVEVRNKGYLDNYVNAMRKVAAELNVPLCDVYAKWQALEKAGANACEMLANRINHPARAMNALFAYSLLDTLIKD